MMIDDRHHHCEPCMERPIHLHVSGLGGDGNSSYTLLTNKPKINGHELVGNKTSKDLGIPVKTSDLEDDGTYIKEQVQSNWNEDDPTSPAYIKNRPFYTGLIPGDTVFNETVFIKDYTTYGYGYKKDPNNFLYEEGKKYIISWDGTEYTFTAETKDGHVTIGDISTEPYIRSYTYTDINTGNPVLIIDHPSDVDAEHAIKITPMTGGIVPIPSEYIPNNITGSGTNSYIPMYDSSNTITDSPLKYNDSTMTFGGIVTPVNSSDIANKKYVDDQKPVLITLRYTGTWDDSTEQWHRGTWSYSWGSYVSSFSHLKELLDTKPQIRIILENVDTHMFSGTFLPTTEFFVTGYTTSSSEIHIYFSANLIGNSNIYPTACDLKLQADTTANPDDLTVTQYEIDEGTVATFKYPASHM